MVTGFEVTRYFRQEWPWQKRKFSFVMNLALKLAPKQREYDREGSRTKTLSLVQAPCPAIPGLRRYTPMASTIDITKIPKLNGTNFYD